MLNLYHTEDEVVKMKNTKISQDYYIGLDIGTNSVGYAVTDEQYKLIKFKGEPMWGVHLFDTAQFSQERRAHRSARRRLDRRQQRVQLVGELLCKYITDLDEKFFVRLQQSYLKPECDDDKFRLFATMEEHKAFNNAYPTIHHLIKALMYDDKPHDVRHVYMACAWLVAHRGHFLSEINKEHIKEITDFAKVYNDFVCFMSDAGDQLDWNIYFDIIKEILPQQKSITYKNRELVQKLFETGKAPKVVDENHPYNVDAILKLLSGGKVDFKVVFGKEEYEDLDPKSISLNCDEEAMSKALADLGDDADLILKLKAIYDWSLLINILNGKDSISEAKVAVYEQHKKDLKELKYLVRKYLFNSYNDVFREDGIYDSYISSKLNQEDFQKGVKKLLDQMVVEEGDAKVFNCIKDELEASNFMPLQVNTNNRVIPYQLYWHEMKVLLQRAESYLPFLAEKDEDGLTITDKLLSIMEYRIPYFVGPLNRASEFAWIERKAEGRILPWNFEKMVDLDKSEQAFINRMINSCTYIPGAAVLPKNSLCYTAFEVLNTINNLKINSQPISVEIKQAIYNKVFMQQARVTVRKLKEFLLSNNYMTKNDELSGIDMTINTIKVSLKAYHGFKNLLNSKQLTETEVEDIIAQMAYSEDKTRFRTWLEKHYSKLNESDIKYVCSLKLKEFGNLSKKLLLETFGADIYSGTGEDMSIMEALWNTNCNLMELLSNRFTFISAIEEEKQKFYSTKPFTLDEKLDSMWINNSVKRSIIRTLDILKDIKKVMGCAPKRIFVEMTRGEDQNKKGKRTKSRYEQLKKLYAGVSGEDVRLLNKELNEMGDNADNLLQRDVLFLYYMQLGKCMYTGEKIEIAELKTGLYNVDHIYPQSLIKDDSILNNKCLVLSKENGRKTDIYPIDAEIRHKMISHWRRLFDGKFITEEKFKRLTRNTPFTESEKEGFVARQLVSTSQTTKAITTLLKDEYNESTEIVYVKAGLVSDFRKEVLEMVKSRSANDLHHAKDAYLNIVVGNVYNTKFNHNFKIDNGYSLKTKTIFNQNTLRGENVVWDKENSLEQVKRTMQKNAIHFTLYQYERKGGLFDQNPLSHKDNPTALEPLKKDRVTGIYGGYAKPTISFFVLAKYNIGKKKEITLVPVQLMRSKLFIENDDYKLEYVKDFLIKMSPKNSEAENIELLFNARHIKVNTVVSIDGLNVCLVGKMNNNIILNVVTQLNMALEKEGYVKKIESFLEKLKKYKNFQYDEKYDGISAEKNVELYDFYVAKLNSHPFNKRPNTPTKLLLDNRDTFMNLDVISQVKCLEQIQIFFSRGGTADLTSINGVKKAGYATVSLSLSNWKKNYKDVRIIDTSASGLFEKASSVNLLDLI